MRIISNHSLFLSKHRIGRNNLNFNEFLLKFIFECFAFFIVEYFGRKSIVEMEMK